jgi:hypothetical protein
LKTLEADSTTLTVAIWNHPARNRAHEKPNQRRIIVGATRRVAHARIIRIGILPSTSSGATHTEKTAVPIGSAYVPPYGSEGLYGKGSSSEITPTTAIQAYNVIILERVVSGE